MKILKLIGSLLLLLTTTSTLYSQSGPPAPSSGIWAIIDTNYNVGTSTQGYTTARLTLQNTTASKITGVQFRVFYDNAAFSSASVSLVGSTANLYLQSVDNNSNGYVTITLVYTGSSNTYSLANGETFELTFNHIAPASSFQALNAISNLTWSGIYPYSQVAAEQPGNDIALSLHNYGGNFLRPELYYHGTFTNVTGSGAKNLSLALEKKPKTSGSWTTHDTYLTDSLGKFSFTEIIDTTYWDVRLAVQGDSMGVGNVISVADAQQINQWVIGSSNPQSWDFYHADVNGDNGVSISDAWGVFGRISGRFSVWPNNVKDIKFFTVAERNAIIGTPATNFLSTYPGVTNFYHNILPAQPDSVTFYVLVPGDANGTGYHMARMTPIEVLITPQPGIEHQIYNVIDTRVEYDFPTSSIEVNVPRISVQEGNLVNVPVKVLTNGTELGSLQFGLKYNDTLLEFKGVETKSATSSWVSYLNTNDNQIDWGGFDVNNHAKPLRDGDEVVTLQFTAKQPQSTWETSPLWTTNKFAGNNQCKDLEITPTNGIIQVYKMTMGGNLMGEDEMTVSPNPTDDFTTITFKVKEYGHVKLVIKDLMGREYNVILDGSVPKGKYSYMVDLGQLSPGIYVAHLRNTKSSIYQKVVVE